MMCLLRALSHAASMLAFMLCAGHAAAQAAEVDRTAARALFREGRALVSESRYDEACPKFQRSYDMEPGMGTLFNLADCYEHIGRTATAWLMFLDVASEARNRRDPRESIARSRASSLEPHLCKLAVDVPEHSRVPGLSILRDGRSVKESAWGEAVPVDLGARAIEASAPGRTPWAQSVLANSSTCPLRVQVPLLRPNDVPIVPLRPAPANAVHTEQAFPAPTAPPPPGRALRAVGLVAGGLGVAGLGAAAYLGLRVRSKLDEAERYCKGNACTDPAGVTLHHEAVQSQTAAYVSAALGAALLVGGSVVYLAAPAPSPSRSSAFAHVLVGPGSLSLRGGW